MLFVGAEGSIRDMASGASRKAVERARGFRGDCVPHPHFARPAPSRVSNPSHGPNSDRTLFFERSRNMEPARRIFVGISSASFCSQQVYGVPASE
jgi:hypothetical protein